MARSREDKIELLRRVPALEGFGDRDLAGLAPDVRVVRLKRRDELFHKGDEGRELFLVVEGSLKSMTTSSDGDDVVFEVMGPGDVFGESSLMGDARRPQTVRAIDAACLLAIDRRELFTFLRGHPDVALRLLARLAERVRTLCEFFEDVHFQNLPERLARKLVALSKRYGEAASEGTRIDLRLSQEEWGDLVGATRESVNKQLKIWAAEGLVRRERGLLVIENLAAIEELARQDGGRFRRR